MAETDRASAGTQVGSQRRKRMKWLFSCGILLLLIGMAYWFIFIRNHVSTDNAYAKVDPAQINVRIPGTVLQVRVENDYRVEKGQILLELDPTDYRVAVERAEASLNQDEADVKAAEVSIPLTDMQTAAQVQAAEAALNAARESEQEARHRLDQLKNTRTAASADLSQIQRDSERFDNLFRQGAGTERQQEQAKTALKRSQAQLAATDNQVSGGGSSFAAATQQVDRAKAQLQAAQSERYNVEIQKYRLESLKAKRDKSRAELETAKLNLSYCTITAPVDGFVAQKNVQVGERVQPGQALMAVVPLQDIYIEANYKETQLTNVRIGQPATIVADLYPDFPYTGRVVGIRAGTGAAFSLIPAENATGNWIKVVQRVPVRIQLDRPPPPDHPLRLGLSLEVTIDTSDRRGELLMPETVKSSMSSAPRRP